MGRNNLEPDVAAQIVSVVKKLFQDASARKAEVKTRVLSLHQ